MNTTHRDVLLVLRDAAYEIGDYFDKAYDDGVPAAPANPLPDDNIPFDPQAHSHGGVRMPKFSRMLQQVNSVAAYMEVMNEELLRRENARQQKREQRSKSLLAIRIRRP